MGFSHVSSFEKAVNNLNHTFDEDGNEAGLLRSQGFWHVLISLRHLRLKFPGHIREFTLEKSYDLLEACFDINGLHLPIQGDSRQVYFEPAAYSGRTPSDFFRHREGPRQTFANRIYTGLGGQGKRQPHFFDVSDQSLPTTVKFQDKWIEEFRKYPPNQLLLDEKITSLIVFIFRFGIPKSDGHSSSFAKDEGNGLATLKENIQHIEVPNTIEELKSEVMDFFGLNESEFSALFPKFNNVDLAEFDWDSPLTFNEVRESLFKLYLIDSTDAENGSLDWISFHTNTTTDIDLKMDDSIVEKCAAVLASGKHLILLGPPGCGKTVLAKQICEAATKAGVTSYSIATATSEWTTFETIGGYMPDPEDSKRLSFQEGIVTSAISRNEWLIIDEFNRADIDKAFGELFTILSGHKVQLNYKNNEGKRLVICQGDQQCNDEFEESINLEDSWRLIGTMNTFDKSSLYQMSYALMRRFAFIEIEVPARSEFLEIIDGIIINMNDEEIPESFTNIVKGIFLELFCGESKDSLFSMNLQVGPGIPIDMLKYIQARAQDKSEEKLKSSTINFIVEAIEMYLYPQFEGHDLYHDSIVKTIINALGEQDEELIGRINKKLSIWTGFEPGV